MLEGPRLPDNSAGDQPIAAELDTFSRAFLTFGIGSILGLAVGYVARILLARGLGPNPLAVLTYAISLTTICGPLALLGLDLALSKYIGQTRGERQEIGDAALRQAVGTVLISSALAAVLVTVVGLMGARAAGLRWDSYVPLLIMAVGLPFAALSQLLGSALLAQRRPSDALLVKNLITRVLRTALLIGLLMLHALTEVSGAACFVLGDAASTAVGLIRVAPTLRTRTAPDAAKRARTALYAVARLVVPGELIGQVQANYPVPLLLVVAGPLHAGIFAGAYVVATVIKAVPLVAGQALLPSAAHTTRQGMHDETARLYKFSARWGTYALAPVIIGLFLYAGPVTTLILGQGFMGAGAVLKTLSLGMAWDAAFLGCGPLLLAVGHTKTYLTTRAIATAAAVCISAALIPKFGAVGAALGLAIGIALETGMRSIVLWRRNHLQPFSKPQIVYLLILGLGAVTLQLTIAGRQSGTLTLVAVVTFFVYSGALALTVILGTREDSKALRYVLRLIQSHFRNAN